MKRNGMGLGMLLMACLLLSAMAMSALAGATRFQEAVALGATSATGTSYELAPAGEAVDSVSVWNESTNVSVTVQVQLYDEYVAVNVYSNTLAARASDTAWPRRYDVSYGYDNVVTGDVVFARAYAVSNAVPYWARKLRVVVSTPTTNITPTQVRGIVRGMGGSPPQ